MGFQLVPVRVEKIERLPFASVLFPRRYPRLRKACHKCSKIIFIDTKGIVGVVALLRGDVPPLRVQRQAEPQIGAAQIRAVIPACMQG